jgi:hypothetical protein
VIRILAGAIAPYLFILVFVNIGAKRRGYRPRRHYVSLLAIGPGGWMQRANFITCGLAMLWFSTAQSGALAFTIGVFGGALIGSGVWVADPALGYPLGTPSAWPPPMTPHGLVHNVAGLVAFVSVIATAVIGGLRADGFFRIYSFAVAATVAYSFVSFARLSERAAKEPSADVPVGLIQRIAIVAGWTYITSLALRMLA